MCIRDRNGEVIYNFDINNKIDYELSSLNLGGKIITYNNAHYGDVSALLSNGRGKTMGGVGRQEGEELLEMIGSLLN